MIKLTAETVMRFVLTRSRMKALTKKEKSQADAIKEAMEVREVEELAPTASPFKLLLNKCQRSMADYEEMAKKAYRKLYGKEWQEQFEDDKEAYGKKPVVSLEVEPNERYKPT
jgi:hypothetical protein